MAELEVLYVNDDAVLLEITYLKNAYEMCGGFSDPTTCGYSLVNMFEDSECPRGMDEVHSHFAMIGLKVSFKICPIGVYHYFFGSSFTHCTPVTVTLFGKRHQSGIFFEPRWLRSTEIVPNPT